MSNILIKTYVNRSGKKIASCIANASSLKPHILQFIIISNVGGISLSEPEVLSYFPGLKTQSLQESPPLSPPQFRQRQQAPDQVRPVRRSFLSAPRQCC